MKFSVLMSTYAKDSPLFLKEALISIKNQTLKASQIVIIKDGKLSKKLEDVINSFNELPIETYLYDGDGNLGGALNYGLKFCLLYTSPSPRDRNVSRMPSSA